MGRIVLYKGQSQYDVLRVFTDQLAEAFRLLQQETVVVDLSPPMPKSNYKRPLPGLVILFFLLMG